MFWFWLIIKKPTTCFKFFLLILNTSYKQLFLPQYINDVIVNYDTYFNFF